jgi:NCS1 family nucleobase:cation symporter-1
LADGTLNKADFTSFVIFSLLCLPLILIKPEKYKIPFGIAAVTVIPTVFILLIYYVIKAQGGGSLLQDVSSVTGVEQTTGTSLAWMLILGIVSNIGNISTHIFSQSDFTRFARKPGDQLVSQLVMVPLGTIVVAMIGIVCTSCAAQLYPEQNIL